VALPPEIRGGASDIIFPGRSLEGKIGTGELGKWEKKLLTRASFWVRIPSNR